VAPPSELTPAVEMAKPAPPLNAHRMAAVLETQVKGPRVIDIP
jgi:hypothetical protein